MPGFSSVLFPTDFSEQSKAFRPFVQLVARQFKARLTVLHVVPMPTADYGGLAGTFPSMTDFSVAEERLGALLEDFFSDKDAEGSAGVEREVLLGDPAVMIADYARSRGAGLIMMATHGHGRFRSLLMGSVASKVLHDAECPVWTAAHAEDPATLSHLGIKNILAAVDLAPDQIDVVNQTAELARAFDASARLLHAVPAAERVPGDTGGDEFSHFLLRTAREKIDAVQREAGTGFEVLVRSSGVAQSIREEALATQADLVVLGRGVRHEAFGRLLSKSYEIIRQSPCPVLSL
jgi:nucleotide-binding universal stress UspA family protein